MGALACGDVLNGRSVHVEVNDGLDDTQVFVSKERQLGQDVEERLSDPLVRVAGLTVNRRRDKGKTTNG